MTGPCERVSGDHWTTTHCEAASNDNTVASCEPDSEYGSTHLANRSDMRTLKFDISGVYAFESSMILNAMTSPARGARDSEGSVEYSISGWDIDVCVGVG